MKKKVILITGCASGIGLALAKRLKASKRYHVVATARAERLSKLPHLGLQEEAFFWIRGLDVTNVLEIKKLVSEIDQKLGGVDILVNNAAIFFRAVLEHLSVEQEQLQMMTNFHGPMHLIRSVLPSMRKKQNGRIINVSSVGGMMAVPTMYAYSASKFALEGASESLWYALRPWNISVTLIEPGFIRSTAGRRVREPLLVKKSLQKRSDPFHAYYTNMKRFVQKLNRWSSADSETVARKIFSVIESKKTPPLRVLATLDALLFHWMRRVLPRAWYHFLFYTFLPRIETWGPSSKKH